MIVFSLVQLALLAALPGSIWVLCFLPRKGCAVAHFGALLAALAVTGLVSLRFSSPFDFLLGGGDFRLSARTDEYECTFVQQRDSEFYYRSWIEVRREDGWVAAVRIDPWDWKCWFPQIKTVGQRIALTSPFAATSLQAAYIDCERKTVVVHGRGAALESLNFRAPRGTLVESGHPGRRYTVSGNRAFHCVRAATMSSASWRGDISQTKGAFGGRSGMSRSYSIPPEKGT